MPQDNPYGYVARIIHLRSLLASIVFAGAFLFFGHRVAEVVSITFPTKFVFLFFLVLMTLYICASLSKRRLHIYIPTSITIFTYGLLFFIDSSIEKTIFALCTAAVFYVALLGIVRFEDNSHDATARSFLSIGLIASLFLYLSVAYALYLNLGWSLWVFLILNFTTIFVLSVASLHLYSRSRVTIILYSMILAFVMLQIMWMENFWPFNYLTMGAVNLMFYYVLWDMMQASLTHSLSKRRALSHIIISIALLVMVLLSTRWALIA